MARLLSSLSPVPSFPRYTGPYEVGSTFIEIPTSELQDSATSAFSPCPTIAFRLFYPCAKPAKAAKPVYWVHEPQRKIISAYARFLGLSNGSSNFLSFFPQFLYRATIPVYRDAPLLESAEPSGRWPVMVFSHGLGGSRNAYSHICGSLASYGIFVLAPEHRDGSCPISYVSATKDRKETSVDYKVISHKASKEVYEARDEQLQTRLWELHLSHTALQRIERGEPLTNLAQKSSNKKNSTSLNPLLEQFASKLAIKEPGSITWAGHSFGATTTILLVKSLFYHPSNPHYHNNSLRESSVKSHLLRFEPSHNLLAQITPSTPTILLDPWALPLNSPNNLELKAKAMPFYSPRTDSSDFPATSSSTVSSSPVLAILSSAFVNWTQNYQDIKTLLKAPSHSTSLTNGPKGEAHIFYPLNSAHLSQSDFGLLFPWVTKYLAKSQEPERTMVLNVRAILQVLREAGIKVAPPTSNDGNSTSDQDGNDEEILSKEAGKVRGWVAVNANEAEKVEAVASKEKGDVGRAIKEEGTLLRDSKA